MDKVVAYVRKIVQKQGFFKPIIISDIDGVLLRGSTPVQGTKEAVLALRQAKIPLALLTNGGGNLQKVKCDKMNSIFKETLFTPDLMFMNHSPIRPHLRKYSQQGLLLITGSLNVEDVVTEMGISNYVTADQLYHIFHGPHEKLEHHSTLTFRNYRQNADEVKERIKQRLGRNNLPTDYHEWGLQIQAIFALNDVNPYETALEVIHNMFQARKEKNLPLPPYFAGHNDIAFAGGYHRPRMAFGPFNYLLEAHCKRHNFKLTKHYFGKPQKATFDFVHDIMTERFGEGCFFMVGDNPRADIKGANSVEWGSFMTQTGVHHGPDNDPQNPATMVVKTFAQAMDVILQIKKDKLYK